MRKFIVLTAIAFSALVLIQSCSKSSDNNTGPTTTTTTTTTAANNSFDRKAMLTNMSTNIIVPAYTAFQTAASNLDAAVTAFNTSPDAVKLSALQTAFIVAYKQWQTTGTFELGPAAVINFRVNTNTYPADINQINANVSSGTYNPNLLANLAAKGLPALDFLLFGVGTDNTAILSQYTTDVNAAKRKTYLAALTTEMKTNATTVATAWTSTYPATFIAAAGTDAGSSTALLVNELVYDYEILKNFEVGIPAGTQSMGITYPAKVQAYYSKISVQLATAHLTALQNLYLGKSMQGDGIGLDDYLNKVNAQKAGTSLDATVKAQFAAAMAKLQTLTDPLSDQIKSSPATVSAAYTECQKLTVLLKTDMTSALGILINYGDNDGD